MKLAVRISVECMVDGQPVRLGSTPSIDVATAALLRRMADSIDGQGVPQEAAQGMQARP